MKVLLLYEYPPPPGGLATQGDLLYRGLREIGVDACATHLTSDREKEWYYRWFKPDVVVGIGYWGHTPDIVLHPLQFGLLPVPWLVADGYIADYQDVLNSLPLKLVTSNWVKEVYVRDGIVGETIEVLPVGCDTDYFCPHDPKQSKVAFIREMLGISPEQIMILTVGGDAASKGSQEVMKALACYNDKYKAQYTSRTQGKHRWKYICKVWPQERTFRQNKLDLALAQELGIDDQVFYWVERDSRDIMPFIIAACDIYAAPSRLEGFGMPQVEAGACGKPVISMAAMAMLDTLVHGKTALLARIGVENKVYEANLDFEDHPELNRKVTFDPPRIADYRANIQDLCQYFEELIESDELRQSLGSAARKFVVDHFDYRVVARRFTEIISQRLGIQ